MPYRFRVLGLLFALVFVMYLDRLCIAVAGPRMQREMGISPSHWGWVIGAFTFAYALFEIPSGILGDRIGPRKILTRIVLWWSAFTALTGVATSFRALLAVRFLFGAGEAGAFPNCTSAVSRWVPKVRTRSRIERLLDCNSHERRSHSSNRRCDRTAPRMAGRLLHLRMPGRLLERDLVLVVPRLAH